MKRTTKRLLLMQLLSCCMLFVLASMALTREKPKVKYPVDRQIQATRTDMLSLDGSLEGLEDLHVSALLDTHLLADYTFDGPGVCVTEGWTSHDVTAQTGCYFHVDDFTGLGGGSYGRLVPLEGNQSVWCGARPDPNSEILCHYATLPGYGNNWYQGWCSPCFQTDLLQAIQLDYHIVWDSEVGYDYTYVEYAEADTCTDLDSIDDILTWGMIATYDGVGSMTPAQNLIAVGHKEAIRIRFRFTSDAAWSDEDGLLDTDGAVIIDSVTVRQGAEVLSVDDYEDESPGDLQAIAVTPPGQDSVWTCWERPGYGDYAGLYSGSTQLQQDPCIFNATCLWEFINGSTDTYAWGGFPGQLVVPYCNNSGQCIKNEIWSPAIPWGGLMVESTELVFDVCEDLVAWDCLFYVWHVRSIDAAGCPGEWRDRGFIYAGFPPSWNTRTEPILDLIQPGAQAIQVALGVWDLCDVWGGTLCRAGCNAPGVGGGHTNSPMYDNVKVYNISTWGPNWPPPDPIDLFHDTFPRKLLYLASDRLEGTYQTVATGRIDMGRDISSSPGIIVPGDSATIKCVDLKYGILEPEPYTGFGGAVYFYMSRDPETKSMPLDKIVEDSFRWPVVDSVMCNGKKWYQFRMDTCFTGHSGPRTDPVPDSWCIDVNDNYFTNGDTLWFFFGAENANYEWSYWSEFTGMVNAILDVCRDPMEMQILPGAGHANGGDILYVDKYDGYGAQPYFDSAFELMGIDDLVDRYDVRDPFVHGGNGPASRVTAPQLISAYRKIIWNTGDLKTGTIGDGLGPNPCKESDDLLLEEFLDLHTDTCGIYFSGDNIAEEGVVAILIDYFLGSGDHQSPPFNHPVSPYAIGQAGGIFDHAVSGCDTMIAFGGCPKINDFDVIEPTLTSVLEMTYDGEEDNPAVISQTKTNSRGNLRNVVLSGFSFHYIRDDRPAGIPDRAHHLTDILRYLQNIIDDPVNVGDHVQYVNALYQNYPNPFNPSTTIKYAIKDRSHVTLKIYNVAGQLVKTLVDADMKPGAYATTWDGQSNFGNPVSSGVYFYKLVTRDFTKTKKLVILR